MKTLTKRLATSLVCLCLLLSLMPMLVSAALYEVSLTFDTAGDVPVDTHRDQIWKYNDVTPATITIADGALQWKRTKANYSAENSAYIRFTPQTALYGVVQVSFDIWFDKTIPDGMYAYDLFDQSGQQLLKLYGNKLLSKGGNVIAELSAGTPTAVQLLLDYNEGKYTISSGEKSVTESVAITKFDFAATIFTAGGLASSTAIDDITMYLDNYTVRQISLKPPKLSSASIDGKRGVGLMDDAVLTYDVNIDADSPVSQIYYESASGATTAAAAVVAENTVTVRPQMPLAAGTSYTLVVPAGAVKADEADAEAANISFATKRFAADRLDAFFDFNNFQEGDNAGVIVPYIKDKSNYLYQDNTLSSSWANVKGTNIEYASQAGGVTETDNIVIENGMMAIKSQDAANWMRFKTNQPITSGKVRVRYDFSFGTVNGSGFIMETDTGMGIYIDKNSTEQTQKVGFYYGGAWQSTLTSTAVANKVYSVEFNYDLTNGTGTVTFDGNTFNGTLTSNSFQYMQLKCPTSLEKLSIDNLSVEHLAVPTAVCSVVNGAEEVSTVGDIRVDFNSPMTDANMQNITLKTGDTAAPATIVPDADGYGCTVKLTAPLETQTSYTLTVPAMTDANGSQMTAQTIIFTTAATIPEFYISSYNVPQITAGGSVTASATFNYTGSETAKAWLGMALYSADHRLLKLGYGEYAFTAPGVQTVSTEAFIVPADQAEGAYVKIFAWKNGLVAMQPICATLQ